MICHSITLQQFVLITVTFSDELFNKIITLLLNHCTKVLWNFTVPLKKLCILFFSLPYNSNPQRSNNPTIYCLCAAQTLQAKSFLCLSKWPQLACRSFTDRKSSVHNKQRQAKPSAVQLNLTHLDNHAITLYQTSLYTSPPQERDVLKSQQDYYF